MLCDLISTQAAVLERNVSAEVARQHKYATLRTNQALARLARRALPELGEEDAFRLAGLTSLAAGAAWPYIQPARELASAYPDDPVVAALHVDFADVVRQAVEVAISGLLARSENVPLGARPLSAIPPVTQ